MLWNPRELFFDRGHPQGFQPLVEHLEKTMALSGIPLAPGENDIIITSGFQRALSVVLRLLLRPGQKVAIEAPTYSAIINLLLAERIDHVAIPMDAEGMDTEFLASVLAQGEVRAVITIPTFHNPTGITLSPSRREHLLRLAVRHRVPLIEDDWGRELRYDGSAPPPLKALDPGGYVIHIGTFSKVFLPGLRLGWVTCPSELAPTLVAAKLGADQGDSFFLQALLHEFIRRGHYARHVRHVRAEYRKRRTAMCRLLSRHLPPGCSFTVPQGGFSVWVTLPPTLRSLPLFIRAREAGLEFLPAAYCMPDRRDAPALRLAFSRCSLEQIETGIPRLCDLLARCSADPALLERDASSFEELYR
jgi:2-aminoadipate transaminase